MLPAPLALSGQSVTARAVDAESLLRPKRPAEVRYRSVLEGEAQWQRAQPGGRWVRVAGGALLVVAATGAFLTAMTHAALEAPGAATATVTTEPENRALEGLRASLQCPKRLERCKAQLAKCGPKAAGCETLLEQCHALAVSCKETLSRSHGVESMPEEWFEQDTNAHHDAWDERSYVGWGRGQKPGADDREGEMGDEKRPCGKHGYLDTLGLCKCAVLYGGSRCKAGVAFTLRLPSAWDHALKRIVPMRDFKAQFDEKFIVTRKHKGFETTSPFVLTLPSHTDKGPGPTKKLSIGTFDRGLYEASPEIDPFYSKVYDRCAVVGNSAVLLHMRNGELIDAHDAVFRFNGGVTEKFKPYVGTKTTFRLVNERHLTFREKDDEVVLHAPRHATVLEAYKRRAMYKDGKRKPVYLLSPEFVNLVDKSVMEFEPTIGWTGMMLAMQVCRRVDLFGAWTFAFALP